MSAPEGFIIDPDGASPLDLGNGGALRLASLTIPPAQKLPTWATNGDADGQALVRNPYHGNRGPCTMQVRVAAASMDDAMAALGALEAKLQEACVQGAAGPGLPFLWTPSGASTGLTGYMLLAEITDLPVTYADGWFANRPIVTVSFTCKPFLYGAEITGPTASGTAPLLTVDVPDVPGDVTAEARLVITDASSQARRWVEWGLEALHYDPAHPSALFIDSASLVTTGFAGSGSALSGAYGGSVVAAPLYSQPTAVCGTGSLPHVGTFRVKARINAASTDEYWRLSWQEADGAPISNAYVQPVAGTAFNEIDLGIATVEPPVEAGTQVWSGRVEAYTTAPGGEVGAVDYLALIPVEEGYGRLEGAYSYQAGAVVIHDAFTGTSSGGTLNGRVAPTGGTWFSSGGTPDFKFSDGAFGSGSEEIARTVTSSGTDTGRTAELSTTSSLTDTDAAIDCRFSSAADPNSSALCARLNGSGYVLAGVAGGRFQIATVISGTQSLLGDTAFTLPADLRFTIRLVVYASGRIYAAVSNSAGATIAALNGLSDALKTGGALASGGVAILDQQFFAPLSEHYYDNFSVSTPAAEPLIVNQSRSLEVCSDSNRRWSTAGTTYADLPSRGSRLFIPPAGTAGRTSRLAVRAIREDPVTMASRNDGDTTELAVYYKPRYLGVPRGS